MPPNRLAIDSVCQQPPAKAELMFNNGQAYGLPGAQWSAFRIAAGLSGGMPRLEEGDAPHSLGFVVVEDTSYVVVERNTVKRPLDLKGTGKFRLQTFDVNVGQPVQANAMSMNTPVRLDLTGRVLVKGNLKSHHDRRQVELLKRGAERGGNTLTRLDGQTVGCDTAIRRDDRDGGLPAANQLGGLADEALND